jgi:hypothetical protein
LRHGLKGRCAGASWKLTVEELAGVSRLARL